MHVASYYGNVTSVLILLEHGSSPDIPTNVVSSHFILREKISRSGVIVRVLVIPVRNHSLVGCG